MLAVNYLLLCQLGGVLNARYRVEDILNARHMEWILMSRKCEKDFGDMTRKVKTRYKTRITMNMANDDKLNYHMHFS